MSKTRYIEKSTGKWWNWCGFSVSNGIKEIHLLEWNDDSRNYIYIPEDEFLERFERKPFDKPSINIEQIIPRHPIQILLKCPVCGSNLKVEGGVILTSPLKYEHVCSNNECTYEGICKSSYYSGMYAAVTDEQEQAIANGTYNEYEHGKIIELQDRDLWTFKNQ